MSSAPDRTAIESRPDGAPSERPVLSGPFRIAPRPSEGGFGAQWLAISAGIAADRAVLATCRAEPAGCPAAARRFLAVVDEAAGGIGRVRLGTLNRAINLAVAYTSDRAQHGRDDVWSAPLATFASGMGDCEDYAIAKYVALLEAGVPPEDVRIVIVEDRWSGLHAVASARLNGAWLVLDNRRMTLAGEHDVTGYRTVATFEERSAAPVRTLAGAAVLRSEPAVRPAGSGEAEPAS